ncbi:hypothetical protein RFI_01146, partial [Reticulomyxa filosa]
MKEHLIDKLTDLAKQQSEKTRQEFITKQKKEWNLFLNRVQGLEADRGFASHVGTKMEEQARAWAQTMFCFVLIRECVNEIIGNHMRSLDAQTIIVDVWTKAFNPIHTQKSGFLSFFQGSEKPCEYAFKFITQQAI